MLAMARMMTSEGKRVALIARVLARVASMCHLNRPRERPRARRADV